MGLSVSRVVGGAALVFSCLAVMPASARADEVAAETLFQEGLAAMKRNDFVAACEAFAGSNKADPSPGTQINLAVCYEKQKKWASAWTWYRSAFGLAQQRNQKEREQLADESANRLKPQLHYVVIAVKEPLNDVVVKRDGNQVTTSIGDKDVPLPIDPGEHLIEVSARGKKPWSQKLNIADNALTDRVDVPVLQDAPEDTGGAPAGAGPGREKGSSVIMSNDGSGQRTVGIVVAGAGVLAGIAAVVTFVVAKDQESKSNDYATRAASATGDDRKNLEAGRSSYHDAAKSDQLIAIALAGGAVVLVGVGAVLFFTAPKATEKTAKPNVIPLVGPSFAGLGLNATF